MLKYSMQLFWSEEDREYVALIPEFPYLSALATRPDKAVREAVLIAEAFLEEARGLAENGRRSACVSFQDGWV
jgi:predicted RNase H-like HicB family nuclease